MKKQIKMVVWAVMLVMLTTGLEIAEAGRRKQVPVTVEITEEHYRQGMDYYRQKEYFRAKVEFDKVLFLSPGYKSAEKYLKLAAQETVKDLDKKAKEDYQGKKPPRRKASVCEYLYDSGRDSYFAGRYQEAFQSFKQVLLLEPVHKGATVYLLQIRDNLVASNAVSSEVTEEIEQRTKLRKEAVRLKAQKKAEEKQAREAKKEAKKEAKAEKKKAREAGKAESKSQRVKESEEKKAWKEAVKQKKQEKKLAAQVARAEKLRAREAKKEAKKAAKAEKKKAREEAKGKKKVEIGAKEEKDKKEQKELAAEVVQSKELDARQVREKAREEEKKAREEAKTKKKIEAKAKKEAQRKLKQEKKEAREHLRKAREEKVRKKKREKRLASELAEVKKLQLNAEERAIAERVIGYYLEGKDCYHYRQYKEAIELFQKALELDPDYSKAANYLKKAQKKLDRLGNK